ncbi:MAG: hypothetical protein IJE89_01560 [Bacilli bacterium]|nr:hypothetical protein [Bacilli bacterium]
MMKKNMDILNNIKIAHRGLWNDKYPENSMGAFDRAINNGIPVELDVHILKDNTLVVIHDDDTYRMTGKRVILKNAVYDDIKDLKLKGTKYKIPTLEEVLLLVNGKVLIDIEIKIDVFDFSICHELCKLLDKYKGSFLVKSFNPIYIWWFRCNRSNYMRGLLVSRLGWVKMSKILKYMLFNMWFNSLAKPDFISFDYRDLPNKKIDKLYKEGMPILIHTIKDNNVIDLKYSGYIYENE